MTNPIKKLDQMIAGVQDLAKKYNPDQPRAPKGEGNGGQWVAGSSARFRSPQSDEEKNLRMKVIEDRGDRVLVESDVDMPIKPTSVLPKSELENDDLPERFVEIDQDRNGKGTIRKPKSKKDNYLVNGLQPNKFYILALSPKDVELGRDYSITAKQFGGGYDTLEDVKAGDRFNAEIKRMYVNSEDLRGWHPKKEKLTEFVSRNKISSK